MKKSPSSSQNRSKESPAEKAIGGQPENDQDAREAGLKSATSGETTERKSEPPKQVSDD